VTGNAIARTGIETGWAHWGNGDIAQAQSVVEGILKDAPTKDAALHLQSLCLFVRGKYREAIAAFSKMDTSYAKYSEVGKVMVDAYIHLNEPENAFALAKRLRIKDVHYYQKLAEKPFSCSAGKTFIIPFITDPNHQIGSGIIPFVSDPNVFPKENPSKYFPWVAGKVNGKRANIGFDTGGPFLVVGKEAAKTLGIALDLRVTGEHGPVAVACWRGIADKVEFGTGLEFKNVPVVVMESLGPNDLIFGTNILERFLATVDYPNSRFILTPRSRKDLYSEHLALLPKGRETLPFYMWSGHYMFAKGSFNKISGLNFFFDSGLVALRVVDGEVEQAPFTASEEKLISWGFDESKLGESTFLPTEYPLGVKSLVQENTLVWYDVNLQKDRNFAGIRIDGLISHAFLSKYSWTIDFDKHEYIFGIY
jgi:hypothetical protein